MKPERIKRPAIFVPGSFHAGKHLRRLVTPISEALQHGCRKVKVTGLTVNQSMASSILAATTTKAWRQVGPYGALPKQRTRCHVGHVSRHPRPLFRIVFRDAAAQDVGYLS